LLSFLLNPKYEPVNFKIPGANSSYRKNGSFLTGKRFSGIARELLPFHMFGVSEQAGSKTPAQTSPIKIRLPNEGRLFRGEADFYLIQSLP
jgi:hypothetical protein